MKHFLSYIFISLFSAIVAVVLFQYMSEPQIVYMNSGPNHASVHAVSQRSSIFDMETEFVNASSKGREFSVYIEEDLKNGRNYKASSGSGVIISPNGYIVTNEHVIRDVKYINVTVNDNRKFAADVIGIDKSTDLALLKIEAENLPYATFGDSDALQVGNWVLAVGNPFRLFSTVTAGIVSAKSRNINMLANNSGIESYIQTDAAVNPGNSGGALITPKGELVGINAAIMATDGKFEGYSFAIPSNLAKKIIDDLKTYGAVQRGWMGITIKDIKQEQANELGLKEVKGIYVLQVNKDEAADEAGIKSGDVILKVNDIDLNSTPQFMEIVGRYRPGDTIQIQFNRNNELKSVDVELRNHINSTDLVAVHRDPVLNELGIEIRNLSSHELERLKSKGVYVVSIKAGSIIGKTNMEPGFVITKINSKSVSTAEELIEKLKEENGKINLDGYYENYPDNYSYLFNK